MSPYKDPARQKEAMRKWRQENLFHVQGYEKETRVRPDDYHVKRQARRQEQYQRDSGGPRAFTGCDGEGMGEGYEHDYYVWRMGRELLVTGQPLEPSEVLEFILAQPRGPIYTIYGGNYDFTMILRKAPHEFLTDLLNRAGRVNERTGTVRPARWNDIRVDYIPHKRLSVGRGDHSIVIHDVIGFFQSTFVTALEEWEIGTPEVRARIQEGKERRGKTDVLSSEELQYNEEECGLLAEMMGKLDTVTRSITLSASPYEGAGAIASSLLRLHVTKPIKERNKHLPEGQQEPLNFSAMDPATLIGLPSWDAYYGGRFEITAHGPIRQPVYEYDINSAYPAIIQNLPCLLHGKWTRGDAGGGIRLGYLRWNVPPSDTFGPLPHRNKSGNVAFPARGAGWYWSVEWPSDPSVYKLVDCWSWQQNCEHRPFYWVLDRYQQRRAHKAAGRKGQAMMLKLGYNSLYGKMAQSVGEAPWRNSVYAGLVTAGCRRMVRDAAEQKPGSIVMFATDGIYSLEPLELPLGTDLGTWEASVYDSGLHIVRPGIYFTLDGETKVKSRGISRKVVSDHSGEIIRAFDDIHSNPGWLTDARGPKLQEQWGVPLQFNGLVSLRLAHSQNRPERAGYFGWLPHRMSYNIYPKRIPLDSGHFSGNWRDGVLRSAMPLSGTPIQSIGYGQTSGSDNDGVMDMVESAPESAPVQLEMEY